MLSGSLVSSRIPPSPQPLSPRGEGAFGAVAWGVLVMSRHWEQRWRACLVVSLAVVWRCGWVMRLLGSQRGSAAAWGFRGLFLCSALPIVRVLVRCSGEFVRGCATCSSGAGLGDSYAAAPRTAPVLESVAQPRACRGAASRRRYARRACLSLSVSLFWGL